MKASKVFRFIWRINGVLILLGVGAIGVLGLVLLLTEAGCNARRRRAEEAAPTIAADREARLHLGPFSSVQGTRALRAELLADHVELGLSSGGYGSDVRNVLYIDPEANAARWLLSDSNRVITDHVDIWADQEDPPKRRLVAVVVLVKPRSVVPEVEVGTLFVHDPSGVTIKPVADRVRAISHASLIDGDGIRIIYERDRKYVRAVLDARLLTTTSESAISVPELK